MGLRILARDRAVQTFLGLVKTFTMLRVTADKRLDTSWFALPDYLDGNTAKSGVAMNTVVDLINWLGKPQVQE